MLTSSGGAIGSLAVFSKLAWIAVEGASAPPYGVSGVRRRVLSEFRFAGLKPDGGGFSAEFNPAPWETYVVLLAVTAALTLASYALCRWSFHEAQRSV